MDCQNQSPWMVDPLFSHIRMSQVFQKSNEYRGILKAGSLARINSTLKRLKYIMEQLFDEIQLKLAIDHILFLQEELKNGYWKYEKTQFKDKFAIFHQIINSQLKYCTEEIKASEEQNEKIHKIFDYTLYLKQQINVLMDQTESQ